MNQYYQREIETASREQIKAWQDERLAKQVQHVWDNVPYYRKKMEEKGLTPADVQGTADLHKLPFLTKDDLRVFKLLIGVSGIGPKGALAILSVMTTDDLRFAVLGDDAKAIAKAPGVGAKTAQRLILELKDKLSLEDAFEQKSMHVAEQKDNRNQGAKNEAVQALVALGYSSSEALKAVNGVEITESTEVEDILKAALRNMSMF